MLKKKCDQPYCQNTGHRDDISYV